MWLEMWNGLLRSASERWKHLDHQTQSKRLGVVVNSAGLRRWDMCFWRHVSMKTAMQNFFSRIIVCISLVVGCMGCMQLTYRPAQVAETDTKRLNIEVEEYAVYSVLLNQV